MGSSMLETVFTYRKDWFQGQFGLINTETNLSPGLVTRVTPITAAWSEVGYRKGGLGLFAGVRPVVVAGHAEVNMPTNIDDHGILQYTKTRLEVTNPLLGYARAYYDGVISRDMRYQLSGMYIQNGQYRAMAELRLNF